MSRFIASVATASVVALLAACQPAAEAEDSAQSDSGPHVVAATDIAAGRYMVLVGGCNDCHTPAYARTGGAEPPESEWLKGSTEGHTGPWGTSYGKNLRLTVAGMTEDEWVEKLTTGTSLPPMPWPSVRAMADTDKRAIYRYIKSLPGEVGVPAPADDPLGTAGPARPNA
ncbi:cytochrome C [Brevundimonas sp.]|uniref:cytochrome C n=1 Tax=Brevundimonas sp. TaxID=1871086 RepID=UPI00286CA7CE|nr:cytochrome C [Brevundimonas sp.]